ncbi:MAG TPA: hypothetical protein VM802_20770 [Chitinophaga sp.]|uniref:hypothetical protein n=1 Tax=Chitinophaga sp. TaxID=1869181 RepID=UPI002B6E81A9|nr:hypothetical protein [Chitinophaga sp.]HVI47324.1 hypothetical protein [Chitinophaga sp.]
MFNTLASLAGLRIDDNRVVEFLKDNGFKYPAKPFISNRASDTSYWVQNKKLGIDLLFQAKNYLTRYPLIPGNKKGIFVPVLNSARWYNNKSNTIFPEDLDFSHSFEALKTKLGEPTMKSSDISPIWLNDDGTESFYRWKKTLDHERELVWGLQFDDDHTIREFTLGLQYRNPLFHMYDEWEYEDFEDFMGSKGFYRTAHLMFLQWAIDRDLIKTGHISAAQVKTGAAPVTAWIQCLNRGYILAEDFTSEEAFIRAYINNLSGHDILYTQDVAFAFLTDDALKQNYFSEEATTQLNTITYNEENYAIVKSIIDQRLTEYKSHQFKNSK